MILPRQAAVPQNRIMTAPYNFVPLPEAVLEVNPDALPGHDSYAADRHTGYIELDIETETPFYTRCAYPSELGDAPVHRTPEKQQFFHHKDKSIPVIPGSSLRGMFRTLTEVIGFGKMGKDNVYKERLVYRAVAESTSLGVIYRQKMTGVGETIPYPTPRLRGGYLVKKDGQCHIRPAVAHEGESFVHTDHKEWPSFARPRKMREKYSDQDIVPVWIIPPKARIERENTRPKLSLAEISDDELKKRNDDKSSGPEWKKGILVRSGHMTGRDRNGRIVDKKKMHCVIFEPDEKGELIPIDPDLWRLFEIDRDQNRGIPCREIRKSGNPIFYLVDKKENLIFWGPTMMFRMLYDHDVQDFIPAYLRDEKKTDLAEAIFGTTGRKGRVRFSDAVFTEKRGGGSPFLCNQHDGRIISKILSSPKPTSFQNYLVQPFYKTDHDHIGDRKKLLLHYNLPFSHKDKQIPVPEGLYIKEKIPTKGSVLRGHKFYWNKESDQARVSEKLGGLVTMDQKGLNRFRLNENKPWENAEQKHPQHTVIRPVLPGCRFSGKIHFENLSDMELGVLLAALELKGDDARHRLGMGKPYGMGRIRISGGLFIQDRKKRYASLGDSAPVDDAEIRKSALSAFETALKKHHKEKCYGNAVASIWEIPRLEALALLFDKDGPDTGKSEYKPINPPKPWRERHVLPTPHQVMDKKEPAHPVTPEPSGGGSSRPGAIEKPKPKPPFEFKSKNAKVNNLKIRIHMMQAKDVGAFVDQIDEIAFIDDDEASAKLLAEALKQKMMEMNIWEKHPRKAEIEGFLM